jgi:tetratricopeptide (TPR) repeat protein
VVYASLLLGLATEMEQMQLAAFHARRAATLAPVTVSVVRAAALVLANTGNVDEATELVREMFLFDAPKAATTLAQIDALVLGVETREGVPDDPDAWLAWSSELGRMGDSEAAASWLGEAAQRWPDHLQLRIQLSFAHYGRGDWDALEDALPVDAGWPIGPTSAGLYALRALVRQHGGDAEGARRDVEIALSSRGGYTVNLLAGDLFERMEEPERARGEWTTALFLVSDPGTRVGLLLRLARLEDRWGRPAAALEYWRQVAATRPEHLEARRRIEDLTGFAP